MKLAEWKRTVKAGAVVRVENRRYPELTGERRVLKAQTNALCTEARDGRTGELVRGGSWCYYPAATQIASVDGGIALLKGDEPWLVLTLLG